jgi:hypothetical protein
MIEPTTPDEDEAFNELERMAKQRKESVKASLRDAENAFEAMYPIVVRNLVIEEVAQHVEKLTGFGQDTISSFAIYIRGMKR